MLPGFGDQATWGRCYGHPHDPRTPEHDDEEVYMSFDGMRCDLRLAASRLEKVDTLLNDIAEFFDDLLENTAINYNEDICYDISCLMKRMKNI